VNPFRRLAKRVVLRDPALIQHNLAALHRAGLIDEIPTLFQVSMGVVNMVHRMIFRSETVGVAKNDRVRNTWRARLMSKRPLRFPFLLREGVIHPLEVTGLATSNRELREHVLGAFHPDEQALYDLALLKAHPGELEQLRDDLAAVVDGSHPRASWLADLCVYEGYHARVLSQVERALGGDLTADAEVAADTTLRAFVAFLCTQPRTPEDAWVALREGTLQISAA
jgi:hypothetical protein